MHEQLWPLYVVGGIFGLYTLWQIILNVYYAYLLVQFIDGERPLLDERYYDTNENTSLNIGETL